MAGSWQTYTDPQSGKQFSVWEGHYVYPGSGLTFIPTYAGGMFDGLMANEVVPETSWGPRSLGLAGVRTAQVQIKYATQQPPQQAYATGNAFHRAGAGVPLAHATPLPFDPCMDSGVRGSHWFERLLEDRGSGLDKPAAVIVETVQGEGGVNVARPERLRGLADLCQRHNILLIVDDVQMGCGRTGPFFSFETAGIKPDIVCMSKSIGGYGLPLALTLIRPELDIWKPGEHNGTFRGINPAFVPGTAALRTYWRDDALERGTVAKGQRIATALTALAKSVPGTPIQLRGRGAWYTAWRSRTAS